MAVVKYYISGSVISEILSDSTVSIGTVAISTLRNVYAVSVPTIDTNPIIGVAADVTPAVWSSGASDTQRWEMADTDAGTWTTVDDMPNIDSVYTDQTFGKVLRWFEAQGGVTAESAATDPVDWAYLLREDFSADDATPVTGSRAADGAGNLTFTDTASKAAISGGMWQANGANAGGDPKIIDAGAPIGSHAGTYWMARTVLPDPSTTGGAWAVLLGNVAGNFLDSHLGLRTNFSLLFAQVNTAAPDTKRTHAEGEELDILVMSHGTGGSVWIRGVNESRWLRIWTDNSQAAANLHPKIYVSAANSKKFNVRALRRRQLSAPYTTVTGTAAVNEATTTDGQRVDALHADARIEHTITAATGVTQDILVRSSDTDNGYIVRCNQASSVVTIHKREAGTTGAALTSAAQTWTNATQYRVSIVVDGNYIDVWVDNTWKVRQTTATFNRDETGVEVSHAGANLRAYPLRQEIIGTPAPRVVTGGVLLGIGDSKTFGQTDDTATYANGKNGFMQRIRADLETATGDEWIELLRQGTASITTAQMAADIDKRIADTFGYPTHILINLGANDAGGVVATVYTPHMEYIVDACHARWPDTPIYLSTPWRNINESTWDDIHAANGTIIADGRSAWLHRGVDERVTLKAGDNGATYYSDGVHPNAAGHQLFADTMIAILGY